MPNKQPTKKPVNKVELTDEELKFHNEELSKLVRKAKKALAAAEAYADKYHLEFYFQPAYGMGGTYEGAPDSVSDYREHGWNPSSGNC